MKRIILALFPTVLALSMFPTLLHAQESIPPSAIANDIAKDDLLLRDYLEARNVDPAKVILDSDYGDIGANLVTYKLLDDNGYDASLRYAIIEQSPRVNPDKTEVLTEWLYKNGYYVTSGNTFLAQVFPNGSTIIRKLYEDKSDQSVKDDILYFQPVISIITSKYTQVLECPQPSLIDDPVNSNYSQNTLVWDYGNGITHRIRQIEGMFLSKWLFTEVFADTYRESEVQIIYNQTGDFRLRLGNFAISDDEERIPVGALFDFGISGDWPKVVSDSMTFYPDSDPPGETNSVDGYIFESGNLTWAAIRGAGSGDARDDEVNGYAYLSAHADANKWASLYRGYHLFDTSSLPDAATLTDATLGLYGHNKYNGLGTPTMRLVPSYPAGVTALLDADYNQIGTKSYANEIDYNSWSTTGYNTFTFNATGLAAIDVTGMGTFGSRLVCDATNSEPTHVPSSPMGFAYYCSEQGAGFNPKLVVTYVVLSAPTVTTTSITNLGTTTAYATGNITTINSGTPLERGFCYITGSGTPDYSDTLETEAWFSGTGSYSLTLDSLACGTYYSARAYAATTSGTGYGSVLGFATVPGSGCYTTDRLYLQYEPDQISSGTISDQSGEGNDVWYELESPGSITVTLSSLLPTVETTAQTSDDDDDEILDIWTTPGTPANMYESGSGTKFGLIGEAVDNDISPSTGLTSGIIWSIGGVVIVLGVGIALAIATGSPLIIAFGQGVVMLVLWIAGILTGWMALTYPFAVSGIVAAKGRFY